MRTIFKLSLKTKVLLFLLFALFQVSVLSAGTTVYNGFIGSTEECCADPRASYTASSVGATYQLDIWTRQWYSPGYNDGPLYCKSNTLRTVYNATSTGPIYTSVGYITNNVSQHYYDQSGTGTGIGWFYTSDANNAYADSNYFTTGYGLHDGCDSALTHQ